MSEVELSKPVAWIQGESECQDVIFDIADKIIGASIPGDDLTSSTPNRWEEVYRDEGIMWVTYTQNVSTSVPGMYRHTDGFDYPIYELNDITGLITATDPSELIPGGIPLMTADGKILEMAQDGNSHTLLENNPTGKEIQVDRVSVTDLSSGEMLDLPVPGLLVTLIPNPDKDSGYDCFILEHVRRTSTGEVEKDLNWEDYRLIAEMPTDWDYFINKVRSVPQGVLVQNNFKSYSHRTVDTYINKSTLVKDHTFDKIHYVADPVHSVNKRVALKAIPDVPSTHATREHFVMLEQPNNEYNYFDVYYGEGFEGTNTSGDPTLTYVDAVDLMMIKSGIVPTIISQEKAHEIYTDWNSGNITLTVPEISWAKDYDGVKELVSPPSHFFHARNSSVTWLTSRKRRPDYLVRYWLSLNNDRVAIMLEGDPAPGIHDYYRSFGYIGKIEPFNENDVVGNFGVTVGMGDLDSTLTGFDLPDIQEMSNPTYSGWGEYTSNGMYSMSMLRTKGNVRFQSHYPAFLTQLPNYPSVGTIPPELSSLILDKDGFQKSMWTNKYHASPVYLVHRAEGYRGYLQGTVAIYDHNLVNLDELIVDTEIPRDSSDLSQGYLQEVYKFFSMTTPVNFFKFTASPDNMSVAILKEIR